MINSHTPNRNIYIGTSGLVLPITKTNFPDDFKNHSRLHYYASLFNTLEINSSFYKIPQAKTFAKWAGDVPINFRFTVKLWKGITHIKNLEFTNRDIDFFMASIKNIGARSGCILIQFPASIGIQYLHKIECILDRIYQQNNNLQWQLAIELRHTSWYCTKAYNIFQKYNVGIVLHDMPGSTTPLDCPKTDVIYRRFHGPTGKYDGSYTAQQLGLYAKQIKQWQKSIKDIYVYFNNTLGAAFDNAQLLSRLVNQD